MTEDARETLRSAILARYRSVYAFTKAHRGRIGKSVVVLLLAGRYPGNVARQTARIWAILQGDSAERHWIPAFAGMTEFSDFAALGQVGQQAENRIIVALEQVACSRCKRKRRRKTCRPCRELWRAQAKVIIRAEGAQA